MKVKRLDHFGVDVADLGRAESFYRDVLGMSVQMRLADQVVMRGGETSCALFLRPDRAPADLEHVRNPLGKSHHAFEVGVGRSRGCRGALHRARRAVSRADRLG